MPFVSSKPPTQGAGLELAALRMALERAGGSISAQDRPGGGARFVLQLPGVRPRSILLVDDDPDFRATMKGVIAALGHALDLAGGAGEGMEKLRAHSRASRDAGYSSPARLIPTCSGASPAPVYQGILTNRTDAPEAVWRFYWGQAEVGS